MMEFLTNVPLHTADVLAYAMLAMIAVLLTSGPAVIYYYYRKFKKTRAAPEGTPAQAPSGP